MSGTPRLRVKKYFGGRTVQEMEFSLSEAREHLGYFFTRDGGANVKISVEGRLVNSFEELVEIASQESHKNRAVLDVGLFLSNEGYDSIWPKRIS